jgi:hypothetical protein
MKKRAFIKYTEYGKIIPGSMIVTQGSFPSKEGRAKWYEIPMNSCCNNYNEVFDLERFLSRMNSCYTQVTDLVPQIVYFGDGNDDPGLPNYISDGCDDMYDDGNMYNTNLTQLYADIVDNNQDYNLNIPYTHTQDGANYNICDYTNPPINGYIADGTNYFGSGSTYFTNMYPGMFIAAATGVNVNEFSITGDLGSDGDGVDAVYIATAHPGWTAFIKTNTDPNGDPSVNHIILVYGNVSGVTQLYDDGGAYDDHCLQGLGSTNTAIISIVVSTEYGTPALTKEEALAIANKTLDVYNNATCVPPQALRILFTDISYADSIVGDSSNVSDWNSFFDLPTYGNEFASVTVDGNWVYLYGGSNITFKSLLFYNVNSQALQKVIDDAGCVIGFENQCFTYQENLNQVSFPACISILDDDDYDYGTFGYCYKLTNINFPVLESAGIWTFYTIGCKYFNLPELTTLIGEGTFYQEENIGVVEFNLPKLQNITQQCFSGAEVESLYLPSVTTVGSGGFSGSKIRLISLPLVTNLSGTGIFSGNPNLESVNIPLVTIIGNSSFYSCSSLINVSIPSLVIAGDEVFRNCTSLTTISLPSVTYIGSIFFYNAPLLNNIYLPSCINLGPTVGSDTLFENNIGNTITLTIPASRMTCDAGQPDGDILTLQGVNTVTIITT